MPDAGVEAHRVVFGFILAKFGAEDGRVGNREWVVTSPDVT